MKLIRQWSWVGLVFFLGGGAQALPSTTQTPIKSNAFEQKYIVVFKSMAAQPSVAGASIAAQFAGRVKHHYQRTLKGVTLTIPDHAAEAFLEAMSKRPDVNYIEEDRPVQALEWVQSGPPSWGIDRVDQRLLPLDARYIYDQSGNGVTVYVIDTGIRSDHIDFSGRVGSGFSAILDGYGSGDCNGHGTHVAGTIAGTSYGLAKQALLQPVRVLDCAGSGMTSDVIAGIDWVAANATRPAVVNMSLGGGASSSLDTAVNNLINTGVSVVVAAGNSNVDACTSSPARVANAITVGATASNDTRASYSNYGPCLDLFAPGSGITSAWYTSATATNTISGTSMAAPHVAGAVALFLSAYPTALPVDTINAVTQGATTNVVGSSGLGSPNRLLYSRLSPIAPPSSGMSTVFVSALQGVGVLAKRGWNAQVSITVKDTNGNGVKGATVTGNFSVGGTGLSCLTGSTGMCVIKSGSLSSRTSSTNFGVGNIAGTGLSYDKNRNMMSTVTINKP